MNSILKEAQRPFCPSTTHTHTHAHTHNSHTLLDPARSGEASSLDSTSFGRRHAAFPSIKSPWLDVWHSSQPAGTETQVTEQHPQSRTLELRWLPCNGKGQSVGAYIDCRDECQSASWHRSGLFVITESWLGVDTRRSGPDSKEQQSIRTLPESQTTFAASTPGWKWLFFMSAAFLFTRQLAGSNNLTHFPFISVQTVHKWLHYFALTFPFLNRGRTVWLQPVITH